MVVGFKRVDLEVSFRSILLILGHLGYDLSLVVAMKKRSNSQEKTSINAMCFSDFRFLSAPLPEIWGDNRMLYHVQSCNSETKRIRICDLQIFGCG